MKPLKRVDLDNPLEFAAWENVAWCFVQSGVEATAAAIRDQVGAKRWVKNVGTSELQAEGDYFLPFRVAGNAWTNFVGVLNDSRSGASPPLLMALSKKLKTRAIFAAYEGTSSVFGYRLYNRGRIEEVLHSDGSQKLRILSRIRQPGPGDDFVPPTGFCFYSEIRTLSRGELNYGAVPKFFNDFLETHEAVLVPESGEVRNGLFTFTPQHLEPHEIERADFVSLLSEAQTLALRRVNQRLRVLHQAIEFCNSEYFWAYKARDEYKDWRSRRPTRAECDEHEKQYKSALKKIRGLLRTAIEPDEEWLRSAARNGNRPLVELLLSSGLYASQASAVRRAAEHAAEHEQSAIANWLRTGN